jgi:hypothetical protein
MQSADDENKHSQDAATAAPLEKPSLDELPLAAELFDEEDPRSLVNLLPRPLANLFKSDVVNKKFLYLSEREAERRLEPETVVYKIRIAFWKEFESARVTGRAISLSKVAGLCGLPEHYVRNILMHRPGAFTFCLVPPSSYETELQEALMYGLRRIREEILTLPIRREVVNKDGMVETVVDADAAKLVLQAAAFVDMRINGGIVQKQLTVHKEIDSGNRKMDRQTLTDLENKIKEMEDKLRLEQLQADDISIGAKVVGRVVDYLGEEKK